MEKKSLAFFETLSNSFGPPGFEREVLRVVKDYVTPFSDDIRQDKIGSLLFSAKGSSDRPVILMPGHVDEVGFIINGINDKGFLTFSPLGGWFDQVLLSQRVIVRTNKGDCEGVIAAKPPHIIPASERNKVIEKDKMFIDLGCANKREATEMGVRVGDPVVPSSTFSTITKKVFESDNGKEVGKGTMKLAIGKAFDDRVGAFIAAEVVRRLKADKIKHPNTVVGAATVQEEVGARGAGAAGWIAEPDVIITLEVDVSGDVPGVESYMCPTVMGKGPSILTFDASMIPNQELKELIIETGEEHKIPYQLSSMARGGTDAGIIHKLRGGCPGIVLGVPTRHIHSHVGMLSISDIELTVQLLIEVIQKLDSKRVESLTAL